MRNFLVFLLMSIFLAGCVDMNFDEPVIPSSPMETDREFAERMFLASFKNKVMPRGITDYFHPRYAKYFNSHESVAGVIDSVTVSQYRDTTWQVVTIHHTFDEEIDEDFNLVRVYVFEFEDGRSEWRLGPTEVFIWKVARVAVFSLQWYREDEVERHRITVPSKVGAVKQKL